MPLSVEEKCFHVQKHLTSEEEQGNLNVNEEQFIKTIKPTLFIKVLKIQNYRYI